MVRVYHDMSYQSVLFTWSECIMICRINLCCSRGQSVSPHIAHVVIVYHDVLHRSMRFHMVRVSRHILYRLCGLCLTIYCPCGQSVSRCVAPVYAVHMVRVYHDMSYQSVLFTWSESIIICCDQSVLSIWSECLATYLPCGQSVSRCVAPVYAIPYGQSASQYIAHVVRVYHDVLHRSMRFHMVIVYRHVLPMRS